MASVVPVSFRQRLGEEASYGSPAAEWCAWDELHAWCVASGNGSANADNNADGLVAAVRNRQKF